MKSNADLVVEGLEQAGVRYLFGYIAGPNARLIEALHGGAVEFVPVAHEAAAGFMGDVYGRLTGKVGACLSTLGPGATNMTTGVGNAFPGTISEAMRSKCRWSSPSRSLLFHRTEPPAQEPSARAVFPANGRS